uniref:NAD(P)(+)--arginine ADP-ribosyltransferase n=1 Tax=Noctiluca scintillans TaxID=2966 RepID=A0A7S1AQU8_NOCSC
MAQLHVDELIARAKEHVSMLRENDDQMHQRVTNIEKHGNSLNEKLGRDPSKVYHNIRRMVRVVKQIQQIGLGHKSELLGRYESDDGLLGVCRKSGDGEVEFEVTDVRNKASVKTTSQQPLMWEARLLLVRPHHDKRCWKLDGHVQGDMFVLDSGLQQFSADFSLRRRIWKSVGGLPGHNKLGGETCHPHNTMSKHFAKTIDSKDPSRNDVFAPSTDHIVEACCQEELPRSTGAQLDQKRRQRAVVRMYTEETPLYHLMNKALRQDHLKSLQYFSAFIREFRNVFLVHDAHGDETSIVKPFSGLLWRGVHFDDAEKKLKEYKVGATFVWRAFTSMTTDRSVAESFGNITFQVRCCPQEADFRHGLFVPASISEFSDFPSENEVICPPNTEFKILEVIPARKNFFGVRTHNPLVSCVAHSLGQASARGSQVINKLSLTMPDF